MVTQVLPNYIFTAHADAICCTTNNVVKNNGELVMGAGIAKAFKEHYPWLPGRWGKKMSNQNHSGYMPNLMVEITYYQDEQTLLTRSKYLIAFPTKYHWKDPSDLNLIESSMRELCRITKIFGWQKVLLPKPGCSNGGLDWNQQVYPRLKQYLNETPAIEILERM